MTQAMHRVLVVEDEAAIRDVLRAMLEAEHYRVVDVGTAARASIEARSHKPDLLLVDLGLPDGDGVQLIRDLRAWSSVPVIVLSARTLEPQKIAALDAGADDYVTKPFSAPELLARVRAALRRNARGSEQSFVVRLGDVLVDLSRRSTRRANAPLHLTPLEYRFLECLARQAGMIVRRDQLIQEVWGPSHSGDTRSLRVCLKNLRDKLEPDPARPKYLITEAGPGYRLTTDEPPASPDDGQ
jgi:two-component system KDP operon response regulator KdpE